MELSDRAKARLRIAAGLLRSMGYKFPDNKTFYQDVLAICMNHPQSSELRELVDWVEDYECAAEPLRQGRQAAVSLCKPV